MATESLDSTPVNYTELRMRQIFCDATMAAKASDAEVVAAGRWATRYGVVCPKVTEAEAAQAATEAARRRLISGG